MSNFHGGTTHWVVPVDYAFSDLDIISAMWNNFYGKYCVLIRLNCDFVGLLRTSRRSWIFRYSRLSHIFKRIELTCFLIWQKVYCWLFQDAVHAKFFATLHCYDIDWGLPVHARFYDPDLFFRVIDVSES